MQTHLYVNEQIRKLAMAALAQREAGSPLQDVILQALREALDLQRAKDIETCRQMQESYANNAKESGHNFYLHMASACECVAWAIETTAKLPLGENQADSSVRPRYGQRSG